MFAVKQHNIGGKLGVCQTTKGCAMGMYQNVSSPTLFKGTAYEYVNYIALPHTNTYSSFLYTKLSEAPPWVSLFFNRNAVFQIIINNNNFLHLLLLYSKMFCKGKVISVFLDLSLAFLCQS